MRKRSIRWISSLLAGLIAVMAMLPLGRSNRVFATGNIHEFNIDAPAPNCMMVALEGSFDPVSVDEILDLINSYRYEACSQGFRDPRDPSRNLTMDDYTPMRWSYDLERMSMLRAAEGSIYMDHTRPNGYRCFTAYYGLRSMEETLAWGSGILGGIRQWYSEKNAYVNQTGGVTGHYVSLITPSNTHCGISCFNGCAAGEYTGYEPYFSPEIDETKIDVSQYSGQYTEISSIFVDSYNVVCDSFCQCDGGTSGCSITFDIVYYDYWGRQHSVTGFKYITGGNWTSSDTSVASVSANGTVTGNSVGTATISFNCGSVSLSNDVSVVNGQPMYRLYNPNSGEHFYTSNQAERSNLISLGWNNEGVGWVAPVSSNTPVYRLYNSYGGEHHYTTSVAERDMLISAGWNYEGIGWYSDDAHSTPLYRQYNPNAFANNHNYTTSLGENDYLVSLGWQAEGIGWYGVN